MKHLMSGNEATARGVYEAGIKVCSAYPGTPSTEILENLPQYGKDVYCEWAPNEKVATEVAYGASVAGSRSFCTMKMVGLNVAADPLFTAGYMGVNGAYVVVTADDPSCHSAQRCPGVQGLCPPGLRDLRGVRHPRAVPHHHPRLSQQGPGGVRRACGARGPHLRPQHP